MPAERAYVPGMSSSTLMTADELLQVRIPDKHVELVRGVLVVREPPGYTHGLVAANLASRLTAHVERAGTDHVVVIEPERRLARVYRQDGSEAVVTADRALDGEDVLPGFSCSLASTL